MKYGRAHEEDALQDLQEAIGQDIRPCGLFVDKSMPFLGATPDGLTGTYGIVEVKCPPSCENLTPEDAVSTKKFNF
ncbi:hypothetical protein JTE90_017757 [Oedothorax gibbosus]|uniref:YqaJ viral recombinase domain-containing protein n=1 Tax=Oedothorax gibbosus TaxID=931172 RepID=A0AAV6UL06_9ARAC|nr:hypothetical protein JTE90_017757 [Oedothorax gibbosus]